MDDTTRRVQEMYEAFPYPSPKSEGQGLKELRNLLTIFNSENHYDFAGKRVLDAGTGTGHRLIEAARALPRTQFVAVDVSEAPLEIARRRAADQGVANVEFRLCNLMEDTASLGVFDVILCMGVLHHLSDPGAGLRRLAAHLAEDGLLFLYIYGTRGVRERMRRKQIVSILLGAGSQDFERGIALVKDLKFDSFEYGWNLNAGDEESRNSLIVDAYLNVHERSYEAEGIFGLMRESGLDGFATYGITLEQRGALFDSRYRPGARGLMEFTDVGKHLPTEALKDAYSKLSVADRYRLIDLLFEPNGYTLVAFREAGFAKFDPSGRVAANRIRVAGLK